MGLYTHIELHDQQAAIESLPAVPNRDEQQCQLRATGTDDAAASPKMVPILVPSGAENGAKQLAANPSQSSSDCIDSSADAAQKQKEPVDVSSRRALELCSDADDSEPVCKADERPNLKVHPRGVSLAKQNRSESIGCYFRGPAWGPATNSAS